MTRMTQIELAGKAGISAGHVGHLEAGTRARPALNTTYALADALGIPVQALLTNPSAVNA